MSGTASLYLSYYVSINPVLVLFVPPPFEGG